MKKSKWKVIFLKLFAITIVSLAIIVKIFFPQFNIDQTTVWLIIILVIVIFIPNLNELLERIRKVKKGDIEIELDSKLDRLKEQIEEASIEVDKYKISDKNIPEDVIAKIQNSMIEPRGALINIAVEIEKRLEFLARSYSIKIPGRFFSPRRTLESLVEKSVLPPNVLNMFLDYWNIRNQAAHGADFEIDKNRLYKLAEIGISILRYLYIIE